MAVAASPFGAVPGGTGAAYGFSGPADFWNDRSVDLLSSPHVENGLLKLYGYIAMESFQVKSVP